MPNRELTAGCFGGHKRRIIDKGLHMPHLNDLITDLHLSKATTAKIKKAILQHPDIVHMLQLQDEVKATAPIKIGDVMIETHISIGGVMMRWKEPQVKTCSFFDADGDEAEEHF